MKKSNKSVIMNKFNRVILNSWLTSVLFLLFGIFLLVKPKLANSLIGYVVGAFILFTGILSLISYFNSKNQLRFMGLELVYGIITIIAGILIIFNPLAITSFLTIGIGIWMIINACMKINRAMILKKYKEETWSIILCTGILVLICGLLLIFNPFTSTMVVTQVIGVFIIIYAILDSLHWLLVKKRSKDIVEFIK